MLLQNALFLFIPDIYIRGWTLIRDLTIRKQRDYPVENGG